MKIYFIIIAVCVVGTSGSTNDQLAADHNESLVEDLLKKMAILAKAADVAVKQQIDKIVLEPLQQVDDLVASINELCAQNEHCVVDEEAKIEYTVDVFHRNLTACQEAAANNWTEIMTDVNAATQQLITDGFDVIRLKQKCDSYTYPWLKGPCLARLSVKMSLYLKNARISIETIMKITNERIPAILDEANACSRNTAEGTILVLDNIRAAINDCIAGPLNVLKVL